MLWKFMVGDEEKGQVIAKTAIEAKQYAQENSIEWETIDEYPDPVVKDTAIAVENTTKRKPRADKGQKRVSTNVETTKKNETPKEKSRKKPEYFVFANGELSQALTHKQTIDFIPDTEKPRIIMGHEVIPNYKVSFKMS
jgi:hypothetical protein